MELMAKELLVLVASLDQVGLAVLVKVDQADKMLIRHLMCLLRLLDAPAAISVAVVLAPRSRPMVITEVEMVS